MSRNMSVVRRQLVKNLAANFQMAIIFSKMIQIGHMRCFLTSKFFVDVKNTSYAQFGSFLRKLWPFEVPCQGKYRWVADTIRLAKSPYLGQKSIFS